MLLARAVGPDDARADMKHLALLVLLAACGGSSPKTTTTPPDEGKVVGPPEVAWKDMSHEQKAKFMAAVVVPKFKPMFQNFAPNVFHEFNCATCHGAGAKDHSFKMPNPDIFVLPEAPADFQKLAQDKPDWMKFMPDVEHAMASTLGEKPYDPAAPDPSQFACYNCHTHKPTAGDAK